MSETTYEVFWVGPYSPDENLQYDEETGAGVHSNNVLYMICGTHGLYGRSVPLYIGKSKRDGAGAVAQRIEEHRYWIDNEPDEVKVYAATIGLFENWETSDNTDEYLPPDDEVVEAIESLLIYAHQPAYNHVSKQTVRKLALSYRIFNTGRRSTLLPELSARYYLDVGP